MSGEATAVEVRGVVKRFAGNLALDDVSLTVPAGQLHAIIGPNGAGKSTLFGVIAGEHRPDRGTVWVAGRDVTRMAAHRRVRAGVARAFQVARIFPEMTVRQNVAAAVIAANGSSRVFWRGKPLWTASGAADEALERLSLAAAGDRPARSLSQGDRKRLEIAMALVLRPKLLLLDEPTAGMSPEETASTVELIRGIWSLGGLTVMLTEHDMQVVFDLAQQLTVLDRGHVLCSGDPAAIRARDDVKEIYLGRAHGAA
ncbi:MAG TPA: ABC transporter ATP-binding protein [Streptosporangiaceae bacterium]|nr:ABC transporter ATP-binding protein [Streptosporangiaceae bacterium]